jgi:hypothetical protein
MSQAGNADGHITPIEASLKILHKCKIIKERKRNTFQLMTGKGHLLPFHNKSNKVVYHKIYRNANMKPVFYKNA